MSIEDEADFASLFQASRPASRDRTKLRVEGERRSAMTDKQRSRGGSARSDQMNFRCTPAFKAFASGLAKHMTTAGGKPVSIADIFEEAVATLAKKKGYKGAQNAS